MLELVRERRASAGVAAAPPVRLGALERLGRLVAFHLSASTVFLSFVGEAAVALGRLLLRPGRFRWRALFGNIEDAGVNALPIIALLSFMMGVVIAYQGGQQLKAYGLSLIHI